MIRAVILDLDGTLFNRQRTISHANRAALRRCREAGILLVVATARPLRTVRPNLCPELDDAYLVLCNGAWVVRNGALLTRRELAPSIVTRLAATLRALGYEPVIEANDCYYSNGERDPQFVGAARPLDDYPHSPACKVLAYAPHGIDALAVARALGPVVWPVIIEGGTLLQIAAAGCSKLTACAGILVDEGISLAETAAFGDDANDLPVLNAVGCGIAMANAAPRVIEAVHYITASNDDDGVAQGIARFVLP